MRKEPCRLYLITPPKFDLATFATTLGETLDAGDVACVQLRLKDVPDDEIKQAAEVLRPIVQDRDVAFIMNDRPDLAAECGMDGVHVGQEDYSYKKARALVGPNGIVGVTCHNSRHLAMTAADLGADYVAFGAFFPTTTKDAIMAADLETLDWWHKLIEIPSVAIGGVTVDNCEPLIEAGADFLAVISGVWDYDKGPAEAVKAFNIKTKLQ